MDAQRALLGLTLAAAAVLPATVEAQSSTLVAGSVKQGWWGRTALGLSLNRSGVRLPCHSLTASCEEVSLVGKASIGDSPVNLFGKVGSTYARTYALGTDTGFGLAYGAGLSWDFSSHASATFGWESYDLRAGSSPVRSTSVGLQWRY